MDGKSLDEVDYGQAAKTGATAGVTAMVGELQRISLKIPKKQPKSVKKPTEKAEPDGSTIIEFAQVYKYGNGTNGSGGKYFIYSGNIKSLSIISIQKELRIQVLWIRTFLKF